MNFLNKVWEAIKFVWLVVEFIATGLQIDRLWNWLSGPAAQGYLRGLRLLWWSLIIWVPLSIILFALNTYVFHQLWINSVIGVFTAGWVAVFLLAHHPIAIVVTAVFAVAKAPLKPQEWFENGQSAINRWVHGIQWVLIGELCFFAYASIFPFWNNYSALPLLAMVMIIWLLLMRQIDAKERWLIQGGQLNPILRSIVGVIILLATSSFVFPAPFHALASKLAPLNQTLSADKWLPLGIMMLLSVVLIGWGERVRWALLPMALLMSLYLGVVWIENAVVIWNLPRIPASFVGGAGLLGIVIALAKLFLGSSGEENKRMIHGYGLLSVIVIPCLMLWFGNSQAERMYHPNVNVYSPDSTRVSTASQPLPLVKACANPDCPRYLEAFRGEKTRDIFHDICGSQLVWLDSLTTAQQEVVQKGESYRDIPRVSLDQIKKVGTSSGSLYPTANVGALQKGDTP